MYERHETRWRPPRFMFRGLARYWLEVKTSWVERLHEITATDVLAEGLTPQARPGEEGLFTPEGIARLRFEETWDRLHGPGAWHKNPLVEVVKFRLLTPFEVCSGCGEPLVGPDRDYCVRCEA